MITALFDADGTLYSAQMGRGLLRYVRTHGYRHRAALYYVSLLSRLLLNRLKLADSDGVQRKLIEGLGGLLTGWDELQASQAFEWLVHEYLLSTRRGPVIKRLQEHQAQGHVVLIVSGMLRPCLEVLGKELGVTHLIGTQLEVRDGRYTGRTIPPIIKGPDKVRQTRAFFASRGMEIDWSASFAYGDSITDQDLLTLVSHPVAVHPDPKLRVLAQTQNWELLEA
jgi:HAD superfamily hydrolase (TIGR01490 family)